MDYASEGIILNDFQLTQFRRYAELLSIWNARMDLTAVPESETERRHFLDSLLPLREGLIPPGCSVADVGSGAGFPGLPLAIARPDIRVTLMESMTKRCAFLKYTAGQLALSNVSVVETRAETAGQDPAYRESFDIAAARAVAPMNVLLEYLLPLVKIGGSALCWKGQRVMDEMADGDAAAFLMGADKGKIFTTQVRCDGETQVFVRYDKLAATPYKYPRRTGVPAKKPITRG